MNYLVNFFGNSKKEVYSPREDVVNRINEIKDGTYKSKNSLDLISFICTGNSAAQTSNYTIDTFLDQNMKKTDSFEPGEIFIARNNQYGGSVVYVGVIAEVDGVKKMLTQVVNGSNPKIRTEDFNIAKKRSNQGYGTNNVTLEAYVPMDSLTLVA